MASAEIVVILESRPGKPLARPGSWCAPSVLHVLCACACRVQLPGLGISPDSINFRNTTMDSDKTICVREDVGEARNIVIVDIMSRMIKHKKPMAAEAAIMNAVRAASWVDVAYRGGGYKRV